MSTAYVNLDNKLAWVVQVSGETPPGFKAIDVDDFVTAFSHYYSNGEIIAYTNEQLVAKENRPNYPASWSDEQMIWLDLRTLQDLKLQRRAYVDTQRLVANSTSFPFREKQIQADALSRGDIDATNGEVLNMGELPASLAYGWKCMDNTWLPIETVDDWKAFYSAMVAQGTSNFMHAQMLKGQIDAAATPDEVEAVVW